MYLVSFCGLIINPQWGWGGGRGVLALWLEHLIPGSNLCRPPLPGYCVLVFLGRLLNTHRASLHPGVQMGTCELNAVGSPAMA